LFLCGGACEVSLEAQATRIAEEVMRTLWLGAIVVMCGLASWQARANTLIILLRSEEVSIVAADSKLRFSDGRNPSDVCKIHVDGNFVWTNSGLSSDENGLFNIVEIARTAIHASDSLNEVAARFEQEILSRLRPFLVKVKEERPFDYKEVMKSPVVISVLVLRRNETRHIDFVVEDSAKPDHIAIRHKQCPGDACTSSDQYVGMLGIAETANAEIIRNPQIWRQGVIETLNYLMKLQSNAAPETVGGPVSILRIDKSGALSWLQKGVCN
jgi:hypothetical protein